MRKHAIYLGKNSGLNPFIRRTKPRKNKVKVVVSHPGFYFEFSWKTY